MFYHQLRKFANSIRAKQFTNQPALIYGVALLALALVVLAGCGGGGNGGSNGGGGSSVSSTMLTGRFVNGNSDKGLSLHNAANGCQFDADMALDISQSGDSLNGMVEIEVHNPASATGSASCVNPGDDFSENLTGKVNGNTVTLVLDDGTTFTGTRTANGLEGTVSTGNGATPSNRLQGRASGSFLPPSMTGGWSASPVATGGFGPVGDEAKVLKWLDDCGIHINNPPCTNGVSKGCTDVGGLRPSTIYGIEQFEDNSGLDITITAGSEFGHADGVKSHANGYKIDIRDTPDVNNYINNDSNGNPTPVGGVDAQGYTRQPDATGTHGGPRFKSPSGAIFTHESNPSHWDITFPDFPSSMQVPNLDCTPGTATGSLTATFTGTGNNIKTSQPLTFSGTFSGTADAGNSSLNEVNWLTTSGTYSGFGGGGKLTIGADIHITGNLVPSGTIGGGSEGSTFSFSGNIPIQPSFHGTIPVTGTWVGDAPNGEGGGGTWSGTLTYQGTPTK